MTIPDRVDMTFVSARREEKQIFREVQQPEVTETEGLSESSLRLWEPKVAGSNPAVPSRLLGPQHAQLAPGELLEFGPERGERPVGAGREPDRQVVVP